MNKTHSFLFIEDNQDDLELLVHWIKRAGIKLIYQHVQSASELKNVIQKYQFDIVISDYKMPSFTGFDALKIVSDFDKDLPFILVSGSIGEEMAVNAMRLGCKDYIMKENLSRLVPSIQRELEEAENRLLLKIAEEKIKSEEEILDSIYAALPSGVGMIKDRQITWMNERLLSISGFNKNDFTNKSTQFLYETEEEFERVGKEISATIEQNGIGSVQTRWICKNKREIDVIITSTPLDSKNEDKGYIFSVTDISDQKQVEKKLILFETKFSEMQENLPIGIYRTSLKGKIIYANRALKDILAIPTEVSINNLEIMSFFKNQKDRIRFMKILIDNKNVQNFEVSLIRYDNYEIYATISGRVLNADDEKQIIDGVITDISEQKRVQLDLKESEEKHRIMMESMPDGVYICNSDYTIEFMNPVMNQIVGKSAVGETCYKAIFKKDERCDWCVFPEIKKGKSVKKDLLHPINNRIYSTIHSPLVRNDGEVSKMTIYRDVTDRRHAQQEVEIQREYFEGLFRNSPDAIVILDEEDEIIRVNEKFEELFEYKQLECEGVKINNLVVPEKLKEEGMKATKNVANGNSVDFETIRRTKSNLEINVSLKGKPIALPDGRQVVYAIYRDISERIKFQEALHFAKNKAEESDRLKTSFLTNISHEIRTPMNAIIGFSQLLSMPDINEEEKEEFISLINSRGVDLMRIIDDIIEVSKIEAGHISVENKALYLQDFLEKIAHSFEDNKELKEKKDVKFKLKLNKEYKDEIQIYTDEEKLSMILFNLIENGLKFTRHGDVEVGYKFCVEDSGLIEFYIKDNGIGIPSEKQTHIFDIFRQVEEEHTREYGGTGLGLAISKRFVESMGGKIWLDSTLGKGSTFYFTIPHYIKDEEVLKLVKRQATDESKNWGDKCILVVEDNPMNFMFIDRVLERTGTKTYKASDGKEAVELFCMVKDIDLVLMDINLPKKSGIEATAEMKKYNDTIPIIAQTAYTIPQDENIDFGPTFDAIIKKPYTPIQLIEIISNFFT